MAELDDLLGTLLGGNEEEGETKGSEGDIVDILLRVMPLIDTVNKESDDERLLKALMPYMGQVRREKLGTAQSILKISKLLPLLEGMFGGDEEK